MGLSTTSYSKVNIAVLLNGVSSNALLDTGSSLSHLSYKFSKMLKLDSDKSRCSVGLAINGYTRGVQKSMQPGFFHDIVFSRYPNCASQKST